jgi:hypothetical protein
METDVVGGFTSPRFVTSCTSTCCNAEPRGQVFISSPVPRMRCIMKESEFTPLQLATKSLLPSQDQDKAEIPSVGG